MVNWKEFFDEKVDNQNVVIQGSIQNSQKIINSVLVLLAHIVGFVAAAIFVFRKKDVLS